MVKIPDTNADSLPNSCKDNLTYTRVENDNRHLEAWVAFNIPSWVVEYIVP
jgi:hypothetical protein